MATIVLVHGIAQEQLSASVLEMDWLPALAGGVANSGNPELADRIWHAGAPGDIDVRMAYYGAKFLTPGAQGEGPIDLDTAPLSPEAEQVAEELATVWLAGRRGGGQRSQRPAPSPRRTRYHLRRSWSATRPAFRSRPPGAQWTGSPQMVCPVRVGRGQQVCLEGADAGQPLSHQRRDPLLRRRPSTAVDHTGHQAGHRALPRVGGRRAIVNTCGSRSSMRHRGACKHRTPFDDHDTSLFPICLGAVRSSASSGRTSSTHAFPFAPDER